MSTPAHRQTIAWESLSVGDELPPLAIDVTPTRVVAGAIASRDFMPVHHDRDYANSQGAPDIFMNILTTCGLCARYLSDWAGPGSRLRKLKLNLMAPNVPGDTMVMQGRVTALDQTEGEHRVGVDFSGNNSRGHHVTGSATLALAG